MDIGHKKRTSPKVYVHLVDIDPYEKNIRQRSVSTKIKIIDLELCYFAFKGPFE